MIYEDEEYHNAVFVGYDMKGKPRHYHKRGICIIGSDEICVTSSSPNPTTIADVSDWDEYIPAKEYAQMHNLNYAVLVI